MADAVSPDPRIGSEIAGYRIERLLGRGGMSVVYLAEQLRLLSPRHRTVPVGVPYPTYMKYQPAESILALYQPLKARVSAQGLPDGVESKQGNRQGTGDGQQVFEPIDGGIRFADHRVDLRQIGGTVGASIGFPGYGEQALPTWRDQSR